jgi:rare lipoprotein A
LQFRRSIGLAFTVAMGISAVMAKAHAGTFFSFFETTDAQPASRSASNLAPDALQPSAETSAVAASAADAAAVGAWSTVVIPAADQPVASRALARGEPTQPLPGPRLTGTGHSLTGVASYYWQDQMTATGERFNKRDMTAAHKTLPFGTRVRVTRVDTGSSVIVRINDRGPFKPGRVIDLSERAAEEIGMTGVGLSPVRLEVLGR